MNQPVVEIARFKLNPEVDEAKFLKAAQQTMLDVKKLSGFIRRELWKSPEGEWYDIVYWTSKADAEAAAAQFESMPNVAEFGSMLDSTTINMQHVQKMTDLK